MANIFIEVPFITYKYIYKEVLGLEYKSNRLLWLNCLLLNSANLPHSHINGRFIFIHLLIYTLSFYLDIDKYVSLQTFFVVKSWKPQGLARAKDMMFDLQMWPKNGGSQGSVHLPGEGASRPRAQ